jgi:hypothetical protein
MCDVTTENRYEIEQEDYRFCFEEKENATVDALLSTTDESVLGLLLPLPPNSQPPSSTPLFPRAYYSR